MTLLILFMACSSDSQRVSPKPRAYPKINYPERSYHSWQNPACPVNLQIPDYAEIDIKENQDDNNCWFDIVFSPFNARLHCSYSSIKQPQDFEKYKSDAFKLVDKHNIKANYIERYPIHKHNHTSGFLFKIDGPVASNYQFYLSDSTTHFLRGAFYFNTQVQIDSLQPVIDFLYPDIEYIIGSTEWK